MVEIHCNHSKISTSELLRPHHKKLSEKYKKPLLYGTQSWHWFLSGYLIPFSFILGLQDNGPVGIEDKEEKEDSNNDKAAHSKQ